MSRSKRRSLKQQLMDWHPHCFACNRKLTGLKGQENSAILIRLYLACPAHVKLARAAARLGDHKALFVTTQRGRDYIEANRPSVQLRERWLVDGVKYDTQQEAEEAAVSLARLLGAKIEIRIGYVNRNETRIDQIVRPGDDARCRDDSFHNERRRRMDFAECVGGH